VQDSLVLSSLLLAPLLAGFAVFPLPVIRMLTFLEELLLSQLVGVVYPESAFTGLSKGQGLTRDTLDEVTEAEDLWLQSLERKKPDKKPRTADASPVSRAMVTAMVRGRLGSSESDLLDLTASGSVLTWEWSFSFCNSRCSGSSFSCHP